MGKIAPRVVTKNALDTEGLPYRVQVALAEIAGATREGVLPRASGPVGSFGDRGRAAALV